LTGVDGKPFSMPEGMSKEPHFILQVDNNRMVGFSGCNNMSGSYLLVGNKLSFPDNIAMTRMACAAGGEAEQSFVQALRSSVGWEVRGTKLELRDRNGKVVAAFEQVLMD
jgi:heat shock protein HslJ